MEENQGIGSYSKVSLILFAAFASAVYLHGLDVPLLGPDEPRYAQVAREMFERNDWVTPTLGGFDWFEKPALLYWLQIVSYRIFGVSEFAARFGSALFGLGTVASLWALARARSRTEGWDSGEGYDFPATTLFVGASTLALLVFARGASFDIIVTFPIAASLASYFVHDRAKDRSGLRANLALVLFYFFAGVAVLAKGLVGVVFPFAIVGFYHVLARRMPSRHTLASLVWGPFVLLLAAATWYLPMYLTNGWKFIDEFFIQHHFQRYTSNKYLHPQPFWFFFAIFPLMVIPWMPFFLAAVWKGLVGVAARFRGAEAQPADDLRLFAVAWMLVPLVFFSLSGSKLPGYVLPAVPGAVLLTADFVSRISARSIRWRLLVQPLAAATLVIVSILVAIPLRSWARHETVRDLVEAGRAAGFHWQRIYGLHTVSHNLEFYGATRLVRNFDGRQRRFEGLTEISDEMTKTGEETVLVIVPLEYRTQIEEGRVLDAAFLADNGEMGIYSVKVKR
jgi:4-amino-4-deoxy-L-arabinose transferase-like glycosyltransferase